MIKTIIYIFPNNTSKAQNFFKNLSNLLTELPHANKENNETIAIAPSHPLHALPKTRFELQNVPFPQIHFDSHKELALSIGNFQINPEAGSHPNIDTRGFESIKTKKDSLGEYFALHFSSQTIYRLSMNELVKRLKGHIVRIDHTGINIPSQIISHKIWASFIQKLASKTNLYKYPTTDVWPFILPATKKEYENVITNFLKGREPKFELVYDIYSPVPTIQIDIETDLSRSNVEQLFPSPYGISFPDLAKFFRTVYIHHEWPGLAIRFDIRFKSNQSDSDWETGKWLVTDGGRIKSTDHTIR